MPAGAPAGASFKSYILGVSDGIKKTAEWAEAICGTKGPNHQSLSERHGPPSPQECWRGKEASSWVVSTSGSSYTLLAMQGLGKPGVGILQHDHPAKPATALWRDGIKGYPSAGQVGRDRPHKP